jgi:glycosyltransferase involved in cell wall biosynthesis
MIVQVGAIPPPFGGVSIYVKRMKDFLDSKGIKNQVWDTSNIKKTENNVINTKLSLVPFRYALNKNIDLIHYNISGSLTKNYIGLFNKFFFKNKKKVLTNHGDCKGLFHKNRMLIINSLNSFDAIICVKSGDKEYLSKEGISSDIYEIPAFLHPTVREKDITEISQKVWNFIENHKPIISANACQIVFYNGQDLYGIDMCIDLCVNLKKDYPNIGLIFCLPCIGNYKYFNKMKQKILEKEIKNNFLFQTEQCELYPIIQNSSIFVRPTNKEGDAVSIREALYFKIPTVASDVVPRPEGSVLFANRNTTDFTLKVRDVLDNYEKYKNKLKTLTVENNAEKIMKVYQNLTNHKGI